MNDYFLADDLSGALDAAAAFHHEGRPVTIALAAGDWPQVSSGDVVALTTETRNAAPSDAAEVITAVIAQARTRGARLLYKKIDSTLRGPVAAELAALTAAMPEAKVLFCPANPRVGRTVREGALLVKGVPVSETAFGRDPVWPVRESSIPQLLGAAMTSRVTVVDASSEADLTAAVAAMVASAEPWVAVGSGALARPVAALGAPLESSRGGGNPASEPVARFGSALEPRSSPLLFVGGSANPINRAQAAQLTRVAGVNVHEIRAPASANPVRAIVEDARRHGATALMLAGPRIESAVALAAIVAVAQRVIQAVGVARVFATGGETAFALCRALEIRTLRFHAEIEPGLSLSIAREGSDAMWWAVKPGGFGDERTWVRAWEALRKK
jgi:uncharacterized protein YgbK (DUF1537 family)